MLPQQVFVTPLPPYSGMPNANANHARSSANPTPARPQVSFNPFHPAATHLEPEYVDGGPPSLGDIPLGEPGSGPSIPGGEREGSPVNIAPPPVHRAPVKASEGVMTAMLVHRVQPEYPSIARAMRLSGTVELRAIIGTDGAVRQLEVIRGNQILAQAAVAAVQQWLYQPTRLNGQPVEVETHITVNFVMQ
jgi:protein TonB